MDWDELSSSGWLDPYIEQQIVEEGVRRPSHDISFNCPHCDVDLKIDATEGEYGPIYICPNCDGKIQFHKP